MDVQGVPFQGGYPVRKTRYLGSIIAHCQNIKLPVVCYTHSKSFEELQKIKDDNNLSNLEIKILELKDVKFHSRISEIRENNPNYVTDYGLDGRGPEIMWGKFEILEKELEGFDRVYWVDAGLQHPGLFPWRYCKVYNDIEVHQKDMLKSWWAELDVFNFPTFFNDKIFKNLDLMCENKIASLVCSNPQIGYPFLENGIISHALERPYPVAGMFGGDVKILKKYIDNFYYYSDIVLDKKILCTEECIMKLALDNLPEKEKINFTFDAFCSGDHDDFHFRDWNNLKNIIKPFYMAISDIINLKNDY